MTVKEEEVSSITVQRGAPCGATWKAAAKIKGMKIDDALIRIGLETQFFCSADPGSWDPISGKSPVHIAGELHKSALKAALESLK